MWLGWLRPFLKTFVVVAGLLCLLLPASLGRLIDSDEGYLLMAARLVSEGKVPYRDFFLTQGPLLPWCFGAWFWLVGPSWHAGRLLTAAIVVAMGFLVYQETLSATRKYGSAVLAAALFAFSSLTIGWLTIAKGYGLSALWMVLAVWMVGRVARAPADASTRSSANLAPNLAPAVAGLAVGLAVATRLYTVVVAPVLALALVRAVGFGRLRRRRVAAYALGFAVGLLPLLLGYVVAPEAFTFGTVLYHGIRHDVQGSLLGSFSEKAPVVLKALGLASRPVMGARQLLGLVIVGVLALLARRWPRGQSDSSAAGYVWPILLGASLLPSSFHPQYFCLLVPFLAIEVGIISARLWTWKYEGTWFRWPLGMLVVIVCGAAYVDSGWTDRDDYLRTGSGVPGVGSPQHASEWRLETLAAVTREIDDRHMPSGATWWPGYFVGTRTTLPVELANHFGFVAAEVLTPEQRRRYHVATRAEVVDMMRAGYPQLFVHGSWPVRDWQPAQLAQCGFRDQPALHGIRVWTVDRQRTFP